LNNYLTLIAKIEDKDKVVNINGIPICVCA